MTDDAVTPYVFLDTEVFKSHHLNFDSPNLSRLRRLATDGPIKLVLTSVTKGEIVDDLKEQARDALNRLKEVRRLSRVMRMILPEDTINAIESVKREEASAALIESFEKLIAEADANVIEVDSVLAGTVFQRYFNKAAPFGSGAKAEFPDAFAFAAIEGWSAASSARVYVVSNDDDWKRMCVGHPNLISVSRLDELLQLFTDSEARNLIKSGLEEQQQELIQQIQDRAESIDFHVGDQLIDGEVSSFEIGCVEISATNIVEIGEGTASISVDCDVIVRANVIAYDPESGGYDSNTASMYYFGRLYGLVEREVEITAEVSVNFDVTDRLSVVIADVELTDAAIELQVDEDDLIREELEY